MDTTDIDPDTPAQGGRRSARAEGRSTDGSGWVRLSIIALVSGMVFHTPNVVLHLMSPDYGTLGEPLIVTIVCPALAVVLVRVAIRWCPSASRSEVALATAAGIWILVPLVVVAWGEPAGATGYEVIGLVIAFPLYILSVAAYDGSLFALALSTIVLVAFAIGTTRDRRAPVRR